MKTRIVNELARIASEKYQYAHILHATKDDYAVPEEMVDTVRGTIAAIMANPTLSRSLSSFEMNALIRFDEMAATIYAKMPWESITTAAAILERTEWKELRNAAFDCLRTFAIDVARWETAMK